jgi:thioredoxin reductase (NADPH)
VDEGTASAASDALQTAAATMERPVEEPRELIILGSGPAGLTAAIYAARAQLKPLVIEGAGAPPDPNVPGGQLMLTTEVENYPGFPDGVMGPELMKNFRKQAERFGTEFVSGLVTKVDFSASPFKVWVGDAEYQAKAVIVATGAKSKMIGLDAEKRLLGHGLSTCATCDGFFFTGKDVVVVGGGDSAMEESLFLTKFASSVTIVHRRGEFRASKIMQQRVEANPKIKVLWNTEVVGINGEKQLESLDLKQVASGDTSVLPIGGLFVAIGHQPNTEIFKGQLDMNAVGYLEAEGVKTKIPGVFAAGDVADHIYRQAVTAAGTGCAAAIEAERYLATA